MLFEEICYFSLMFLPVITEEMMRGSMVIFNKLMKISPGNPETIPRTELRNTTGQNLYNNNIIKRQQHQPIASHMILQYTLVITILLGSEESINITRLLIYQMF